MLKEKCVSTPVHNAYFNCYLCSTLFGVSLSALRENEMLFSVPCDEICRGTGEATPDDPEEHVPTVQDSEINLLKSGDVT